MKNPVRIISDWILLNQRRNLLWSRMILVGYYLSRFVVEARNLFAAGPNFKCLNRYVLWLPFGRFDSVTHPFPLMHNHLKTRSTTPGTAYLYGLHHLRMFAIVVRFPKLHQPQSKLSFELRTFFPYVLNVEGTVL